MQLIEKDINNRTCRVAHIDLKKYNKYYVMDQLINTNMYFDYIVVSIYSNKRSKLRGGFYKTLERMLIDNSFSIIKQPLTNSASYETEIFRYENSDEYKQKLRQKKLERIIYE